MRYQDGLASPREFSLWTMLLPSPAADSAVALSYTIPSEARP
jgi:hypothetical protein